MAVVLSGDQLRLIVVSLTSWKVISDNLGTSAWVERSAERGGEGDRGNTKTNDKDVEKGGVGQRSQKEEIGQCEAILRPSIQMRYVTYLTN